MNATFWNKIALFLITLAFGLVVYSVASEKIPFFQGTSTAPVELSEKKEDGSFFFTASGDFGGNSETQKVLQQINPKFSKSSFHLALGDLSYDQITPESAWCDFVKENVSGDFPFMLLSGNHEDNGPNGDIDEFVKCLPSKIEGVVGEYGKQYYFDYPKESPIARFILISPNLDFGDGVQNFTEGSEEYTWLSDVINKSRMEVKWVIVAMHKPCITVGVKECESGADLTNLLLEKRVDLVLMGHDHNYQRTKQLYKDNTCVEASSSLDCVRFYEDDQGDTYYKGFGRIFLTAGTSGAGLYKIFPGDSEMGYFAKAAGFGSGLGHGFVRIEVSELDLTSEYVDVTGTFADTFRLSRSIPFD